MIAMNSQTWKIFSLFVMLQLVSVCWSVQNQPLGSLTIANNDFGTRVFKALRRTNKENFFFSPLSLSIAFGMLYHGAGGFTARQLSLVLGYQKAGLQSPASVSYAIALYIHRTWSREYELNLANVILVDRSVNVNEQYRKAMFRMYQSAVDSVDFQRDNAKIKKRINSWVHRKTKGMIPTLLDSLDPRSLMVVLNAAYFKGLWDKPFIPRMTTPQTFYNFGKTPKTVPVMRMPDETHDYFNGGGFSALELGYRGNMSMLILLPKARTGLPALEDALSASFLSSTLTRLQPEIINLRLPKFQAFFSSNLKKTLQTMGMRSVFGHGADFSGISRNRGMRVSEVVHKASIIVDEGGTVAAAATGVKIHTISMPPKPVDFIVDHPFIYAIVDRRSNSVLFMGRVCQI